jgi:hypothetical protein
MHDPSALVRLEKKLSVRTNPRKPSPIVVRVIARNNEQRTRLQLFGWQIRCRARKYNAVDFAWPGLDRWIARHLSLVNRPP